MLRIELVLLWIVFRLFTFNWIKALLVPSSQMCSQRVYLLIFSLTPRYHTFNFKIWFGCMRNGDVLNQRPYSQCSKDETNTALPNIRHDGKHMGSQSVYATIMQYDKKLMCVNYACLCYYAFFSVLTYISITNLIIWDLLCNRFQS